MVRQERVFSVFETFSFPFEFSHFEVFTFLYFAPPPTRTLCIALYWSAQANAGVVPIVGSPEADDSDGVVPIVGSAEADDSDRVVPIVGSPGESPPCPTMSST